MDDNILKHCKETLRKNNFEPLKKLGMGGFGVVFLVEKVGSISELFSVKCTFKKQFSKKPAMRRYLKQEINLMQTLQSPNIVRLYRTIQDEHWIFMVMEYCDLGNISMLQSIKPNGVFPLAESIQIMTDIIDGLQFMHTKNILHRDIKPENILRKKQKDKIVTKICDLGFSRQAKDQVNTFCGTTYYMAPEIFQKKQYGHHVDIWALGVLFYSMLFGTVPFKSVNMLNEINTKCQLGFDLTKRKLKPNPSIDKLQMQRLAILFQSIFVIDPTKRISLQKLKINLCEGLGSVKKQDHTKTLDTDGSDEDSKSPRGVSFQLQEVLFIQSVLDQIENQNFLSPQEKLPISYFINKVCLSILSCQRKIQSKVQQQLLDKLSLIHKREREQLIKKINICGIPKLSQVFTGKPTIIFREYKEEYRLAVGHAFYKAHKLIKNYDKKIRLKLKIFCCHVINRIFQKQYIKEVFKHYFEWVDLRNPQNSGKFTMSLFRKWLEDERMQKIANTVELVNNKFYRKNGK